MRNCLHLALTLLACLSAAASPSTTNRHITTTREMLCAYDGNPSEQWSFAITGTVTWCRGNNFVLKDKTGNCNLFNILNDSLQRGEIIATTGRVHITESHRPWIDYIEAFKLGTEPLSIPPKTPLKDCLDPSLTLEGVRTEATVVDILTDELDARYDWLILKDGAAMFSAVCSHMPENERLIGARVEVTGPVCHYVLGLRKFVSPFVNCDLGGSVKVLSTPPSDPFAFPLINLSSYVSQADIEGLGKHAAVGRIVAVWPPDNCLLLTPEGQYIRLALAAHEPLPAYGSLVRAVGYPSSDVFTIWLTRAKTRPEAIPDIPEGEPQETSAKDLLLEDSNRSKRLLENRLVTVRGTIKAIKTVGDGTCRAELDCGRIVIPVDFSSRPDDFKDISVGCEIRITGRYILINERWNPNNVFPRVTEILLVLSARPEILHGPGWWTPRKFLTVIIVLVIALVGVHLRGYFSRRIAQLKLNERTQLAVEIHDSLSQALTGLACHITAAQNTLTTDAPTARQKLTTASQMLMSCRTELRNCLFDLRNDTLGEKDFRKAILRTVESFEDSAAILVRFNVPRSRFEDPTVHAVLAIIRELVSNAIRHGHAWTVKVAGVLKDNALLFSVTDDGSGFDFSNRLNSENGHFGLDGIRERLVNLNGSISFGQPRSGGTRAIIRIPLSRK